MTLAFIVIIGIAITILAVVLPKNLNTKKTKTEEDKRLTAKRLEAKRLEAKRLEAKRLEAKRLAAKSGSQQEELIPAVPPAIPEAVPEIPEETEDIPEEPEDNEPEAVVYYKARRLLTPTEANFAQHLLAILPDGYSLSCKPGLWALLVPDKTRCNFWKAWNKIKEKHIDFIIVRKSDFRVMLAIELDDPSHSKNPKKQTIKSDNFKKEHLVSVGIPFLRIPSIRKTEQYNPLQLEALILPYLR